jgi:hypothetical protein
MKTIWRSKMLSMYQRLHTSTLNMTPSLKKIKSTSIILHTAENIDLKLIVVLPLFWVISINITVVIIV